MKKFTSKVLVLVPGAFAAAWLAPAANAIGLSSPPTSTNKACVAKRPGMGNRRVQKLTALREW